jgi:hypothetical protein
MPLARKWTPESEEYFRRVEQAQVTRKLWEPADEPAPRIRIRHGIVIFAAGLAWNVFYLIPREIFREAWRRYCAKV